MKRLIIYIISAVFLCITHTGSAQTNDAATLHETARSFMRQGDFENAKLVLDKALKDNPDNLELLKDQAFVLYLQRDFAGTIESCKKIIARPDADVQTYQILGLAYKATALEKESDKMYKDALKRFPASGVLYSEYGELLNSGGNAAAAIKNWEKGIESDPSYSGNYYFAAKYYHQKSNLVWSLLYGEMFVNMESMTARTTEIKSQIIAGFQKMFGNPALLNPVMQNGSSFEKAVTGNITKLRSLMNDGVTPETLTAFRTRFLLNWYAGEGRQFPLRLFEYQRQLLQEGYFDAYNQWLAGAVIDSKKFQAWIQEHAEETKAFQQFQRSMVFKVPKGQYYLH